MLLFICFSACQKTEVVRVDQVSGLYIKQTIPYKSVPNVAANLLSLDLYSYANTSSLKPIVLYVHGGGWSTGDKANKMENKVALSHSLNYLFVSVNYRLSPTYLDLANSNRVKYPDHNQDVQMRLNGQLLILTSTAAIRQKLCF